MIQLFKDKTTFINMHEQSSKNQDAIIKITQKNHEVLTKINKQLEVIDHKIDNIEKN